MVFLAPEQETHLQLQGVSPAWATLARAPEIQTLPLDGALCAALLTGDRLIPLASLGGHQDLTLAPAEIRFLDTLRRSAIELLMPLVSAQQPRLLGIVALGIKETDEDYSRQERTALKALARTAAISAENVLLFEAQKEERENSKALARAINAVQDEIRGRIARLLHDVPLQEIGSLQLIITSLDEKVRALLIVFAHLQRWLKTCESVLGPAALTQILGVLEEGQRVLDRLLGEDVPGGEPADAAGDPDSLESLVSVAELSARLEGVGIQLRQISNDLHPGYLNEPLRRIVEQTVTYIARRHPAVTIQLLIRGTEYATIPDNVKTACKLILDQAIRNAVRHGQATQIETQLTFAPTGALTLRIADNGVGFTPQSLRRLRTQGHQGLANMDEWAELAAGTLQIESAPGQGAQITLSVPLPADTPVAEPVEPRYDSDGGEQVILVGT
jgi:signal transduction histidine kinase